MTDTSFDDDTGAPDEEEIEAPGEEGGEVGEDDADQGQGSEDDAAGQADEGAPRHDERDERHVDQKARAGRAVALRRRAQAAEERAQRFERELGEIKAQIAAAQARPDPAELQRQAAWEAQQVALMSPAEVGQYYAQKSERQMEARLQNMQLNLQEQADRTAFGVLANANPLARKYATDVERVVAEQKARGMVVSREIALKYVIGEKMMARAQAAGTKQGRAAAGRVLGATTRPGRTGGDAEGTERSRGNGRDLSEAELERRIGAVKF